ncbi:MAG: hypothetical protein Q4E54_02055 [Lachnospiraceae bacterium]|nr:hypothetical protein [Lachnospiraceae bacterium]
MRKVFRTIIILALAAVVWLSSFAGIKETFQDLIEGPKVTLDVSKTKVVESKNAGRTEYTVGNKKFLSSASAKKNISDKMTYMIPSDFAQVESRTENIAGYRYKLNEIPSQFHTSAEDLFVFYFDNEKYLLNLNDRNQREAIEMAIVKNILPGEKVDNLLERMSFPTKTLKAKYNSASGRDFTRTYDYFTTYFVDSSKKTHNVEFVFTTDGEEGLGCLLYVFTESVHKEDILYLMRTIEFK